jgi:hypothetical protein
MGLMKMKHCLIYFSFVIIGASSVFACTPSPQEFGVLEGHVTIGPLVPVVREGEEAPTPAPEVYMAREIVIFRENGKTEFTRLKIDTQGNYRAELPVGTYVVDINRIGIDSAAGLPKQIEITRRGITKLDIDIDTGIR